jgi:hypothetical protein
MVADCKSAGLTPYVGSNPTPTMAGGVRHAGVAQLVEHQPSKLRVAGSSPVARLLERTERAEKTERAERVPPLPPYRQGCEGTAEYRLSLTRSRSSVGRAHPW